ncbi:MAG: hypothetical protein JNN08_07435 [Bryobacterales bacterium]|nr:hypothetical protein [Bryobacterales bacterium]
MATRIGKCSNFGLCSKADAREAISGPAAGEFSCPECARPLVEIRGGGGAGKGGGGNRKVLFGLLGVGGLLLAGIFALLVWPEPEPEQPQQQAAVDPAPLPPDPGQQDPQQQTIDPPTRGNEQFPVPQQEQVAPPPRPQPRPRPSSGEILPQEQVVPPPQPQPVPAPPSRLETSIIQARLLSPISTRQSREGDQFTAKVEGGRYPGAILTGRVTKLERKKKESRIAFQFETINLNRTQIPIKADLRGVTNARGLKGVDDEGNAVSTSSKKKAFILGAVGGAVGGVIGKITGGNRGAAVGAGAGAAAGVVLGLTVVSRAQELHFAPGTVFTLEASEGRQ